MKFNMQSTFSPDFDPGPEAKKLEQAFQTALEHLSTDLHHDLEAATGHGVFIVVNWSWTLGEKL